MKRYTVRKGWFMPVVVSVTVEVPDGSDAETIIQAADAELARNGYDGQKDVWDGVSDEWVDEITPEDGAPAVEIPDTHTELAVMEGMAQRERNFG